MDIMGQTAEVELPSPRDAVAAPAVDTDQIEQAARRPGQGASAVDRDWRRCARRVRGAARAGLDVAGPGRRVSRRPRRDLGSALSFAGSACRLRALEDGGRRARHRHAHGAATAALEDASGARRHPHRHRCRRARAHRAARRRDPRRCPRGHRRVVRRLAPDHAAGRVARGRARRAQAGVAAQINQVQPQLAYLQAIRRALPDDGYFVDEITQVGYASWYGFPTYAPRHHINCGYQGTLGYGYATALGVKVAHPERRSSTSRATAVSCSRRTKWRRPRSTASGSSRCCSTTASFRTCSASSASGSADA